MAYDPRLQLDMTPDGRFRTPPRMPFSTQVIAVAVMLAVVGGAVAFAALALWVALTLIPVVLVAVLVAVAMIRFKIWRAQRRAASFGGPGIRRPPPLDPPLPPTGDRIAAGLACRPRSL